MKKEAPIQPPKKLNSPKVQTIKTQKIQPVKKTVTPTPPQKPNAKYSKKVGGKKETLSDVIRRVFPPNMIPTKKTGMAFGAIFVFVVIIGLFQFPIGSLLAGKTDVSIDVGFPMVFLSFDLENPENLPVKFGGLFVDLIIYLILSYAIDVALNSFFRVIKEKKGISKSTHPRTYKIPKKAITESIAEKAAEKTTEKVFGKTLNKKIITRPQKRPQQPAPSQKKFILL